MGTAMAFRPRNLSISSMAGNWMIWATDSLRTARGRRRTPSFPRNPSASSGGIHTPKPHEVGSRKKPWIPAFAG